LINAILYCSRLVIVRFRSCTMDTHDQHAVIYSSTPKLVESHLTGSHVRTDRHDFISSLVHTLVQTDANKQTSLIESLRHQQQILGTNSKDIHLYAKNKRKHLSRRGNRLLTKTIRQVRRDAKQMRNKLDRATSTIDYNNYRFMNELWQQYIIELCKDATSNEHRVQRMITADYHGAILRIVNAKNPSLIGKHGIVIQETKNIFLLVEERTNRRCSIMKKDCLFAMEIPQSQPTSTVFISGSAIAVRPEQRGQKRSTSIEYMHEFC
jgi:RNase P/RNase MRP subunit p29